MSFSLQIATDLITLEAGVNTPLTVQIINRGEQSDRFEMEVEGLDPEWTAIPVPIFTIGPGETQSEKVFFNPPRVSESLAGNYPFVVKVRSLNSGEGRTAQGVLQIRAYNHLSMEIVPKKGVLSPLRSAEVFHATIINLGNTEQTLQLYGSDPEDALAFELAQEQVTVGPGQQKEVEIVATATSSRPFANPRLHVFTLSARSITSPSVVCSSQAQVEQRPAVTPGVLAVAIVALILFFGWFSFRPQPPVLDMLTVDPSKAQVGETMTVKWKSSNAKSVDLLINEEHMTVEPDGSRTFQAAQSGSVEAVAIGDHSQQSRPRVFQFSVTQPPVAPEAKITTFEISPREINLGQSVLIHYAVNDATVKVVLAPSNQVLDPKIDNAEVKPDQPGVVHYTLFAENASGKAVSSKTINVRVVQASQANVVFFDVDPKALDLPGSVKVTWQLSDAARAQLSVNGAVTDLPSTSGDMNVPVQKTTEFVLLGYDSKGLVKRSSKVTVKVKPMPLPTTDTGATTGNPPIINPGIARPQTTGSTTTTTAGGR